MKNGTIKIFMEEYDEKHVIAFVENNSKSMFLILGLYDFAERMEYWGINMTYGNKKGRYGLIFKRDVKPMIETEIMMFIEEYNLSKYEY